MADRDSHIDIRWIDGRREPKCQPDPAYPNGVDLNLSGGALITCVRHLLYPAPRCGMYDVKCRCGASAAITTAGRPDDPRSVRIACKIVQ